jgi:Domain of unknown function (DUF4145)
VQLPESVLEQEAPSLEELLQQTALYLWKDWLRDMEVVSFTHSPKSSFVLRGTCPHCKHPTAFMPVTSVFTDSSNTMPCWIAGMQCQGCLDYILASCWLVNNYQLTYRQHYPLGWPDDEVAKEIPDHIKPDFQEALRCLWVKAYNATAEMCRCALEASCLHLGASPKDVLEDMIDELADKQIITPGLRDVAHKVRLGGNRAAHPGQTKATLGPSPTASVATPSPATSKAARPIERIEKEHAEAIVDFTKHFFQYVYVTPGQLDKYDFSKPKTKAKP